MERLKMQLHQRICWIKGFPCGKLGRSAFDRVLDVGLKKIIKRVGRWVFIYSWAERGTRSNADSHFTQVKLAGVPLEVDR